MSADQMAGLTFTRTYSFFDPERTYDVHWNGVWIGSVAGIGTSRTWLASNKSWSGGQDFCGTFPTRRAAADHLWHNMTDQMRTHLGLVQS